MTLTMHNCMNMHVADTVDGEVAGEGYGLYEDEEQDNYLEDEGELKDETLEDEFFDTENEEWSSIMMSVKKLLISYSL